MDPDYPLECEIKDSKVTVSRDQAGSNLNLLCVENFTHPNRGEWQKHRDARFLAIRDCLGQRSRDGKRQYNQLGSLKRKNCELRKKLLKAEHLIAEQRQNLKKAEEDLDDFDAMWNHIIAVGLELSRQVGVKRASEALQISSSLL
jgi:hypothetical protein